MKTIAVTGGKGGTGKSTVSVLLANRFRNEGKSVALCDCDVECPNDYLLLGGKLGEKEEEVFARFPKLVREKCTKCGLCARNCRSNAIFQPKGEFPIILPELCSGCGLCWNLCPSRAIEVEKKVVGEVFENKLADNFFLVTGRSVGVVEETGPVVTEVRKYAEKLAAKIGADYLLLDTAVGLHCSVIRALVGVDLAYCVTEPTPLGAHDLELILRLLERLEVPAKIILNQADLGNRRPIDKIAGEFGVKIEYEIPCSRELVEAYSRGAMQDFNLL